MRFKKINLILLVFMFFLIFNFNDKCFAVTSGEVTVGSYITFGKYNGTPIIWRIVGLSGSDWILVLDKSIMSKAINSTDNIKWENSNLHTWLNSTDVTSPYGEKGFLHDDNFNTSEKQAILQAGRTHLVTKADFQAGLMDGGTTWFMANMGDPSTMASSYYVYAYKMLVDKVSILNLGEVNQYIYSNAALSDRKTYYYQDSVGTALRSPTRDINNTTQFWSVTGDSNRSYITSSYPLRLTMILSTQSISIPTGGGTKSNPYVVTAQVPPNTPNAPTFGTITTNSIVINWGSVANATSYTLYRSGTQIYSGSALTYTDTGRTAGTSYSYTVSATGAGGTSSQSTAASKMTLCTTPSNVTFGTVTNNSIVVNWSSVTGATSYKLYDTIVSTTTPIYTGGALTYTQSSLNPNTQHNYRLVAVNGSGDSSQSTAVSKYTLANTPSISFSIIGVDSISLSVGINSNSGSTQYQIERDINSSFTNVVVIQNWSTVISKMDTGLSQGLMYYYRVKARNGDNIETIYSTAISSKLKDVGDIMILVKDTLGNLLADSKIVIN